MEIHKVQILIPDIEGLKSEAECWDIKPSQKEEDSPARAVKLQGMWKLLEKFNLEAADSKSSFAERIYTQEIPKT